MLPDTVPCTNQRSRTRLKFADGQAVQTDRTKTITMFSSFYERRDLKCCRTYLKELSCNFSNKTCGLVRQKKKKKQEKIENTSKHKDKTVCNNPLPRDMHKTKNYETATTFFMRRKLPFPLVGTRKSCVQPTPKLNFINYWYLFVDPFCSSCTIYIIKMIIFHDKKYGIYGENTKSKYTREHFFLLLLHFIFTYDLLKLLTACFLLFQLGY